MSKILKRLILSFLCMLWAIVSSCIVYAAEHDIIIIHTNDMHCNVNSNLGLAKIGWLKEQYKETTPNVILVDAGDAIQGAPLGKLSNGESIVRAMNKAGYDFCIPGNHEFDYGMEQFLKLADMLEGGYYCANIKDMRSNKELLPAYKLMEMEGTKIAFIGITTPETLRSSTPAYFQDESGNYIYSFYEDKGGTKLYKRIQAVVDEVRKLGADYVFVVSHLGMNGVPEKWSSQVLAQNIVGINGVIDGHSHERINGITINKLGKEVLVIQAGSKLQCLGQITITPDGQVKSKLISEIDGIDNDVANLISQEIQVYEPILRQPIGEAMVKLCSNSPDDGKRIVRKQECSLGNFVADAMRVVLDCDVAIVNGGGIRQEIEVGVISYNDLIEAFPFGNTCSVIEVSGQQLLDALEVGVKNYPEEHGGFLQVSGICYSFRADIPSSVELNEQGGFIKVAGAYRVQDVYVAGQPLCLDKKYTLGGIDYILRNGGNSMTMFKDAYLLKDAILNDYDVILEYLQNHLNGKIGEQYSNPYGNGRITVKE